MYRKRLKIAANFLKSLPKREDWQEEQFNMCTWGRHYDEDTAPEWAICGTLACAGGWLAWGCTELQVLGLHTAGGSSLEPVYECGDVALEGFQALARFFGISLKLAQKLFDPAFYPRKKIGPLSVARRINRLLKEGSLTATSRSRFANA